MNISTALTRKNKLAKEIKDLSQDLRNNNSYIVVENTPVERDIDVNSVVSEIESKTNELISLKVALEASSMPIREKIYKLSELKSSYAMYKGLNTQSGPSTGRYGDGILTYVATITARDVRAKLREIQDQIDIIVNEINAFNYNTEVSF